MPNHHVTGRQTATCGFTGFSTYLAAGLMVATITVDAAANANVRIMPMGLLGQRTVRGFMASGWQERLRDLGRAGLLSDEERPLVRAS